MSRGTPIVEARVVGLRDGGYIVFDSSHWASDRGLERVPIFACSSKDELLDFLEKRLAEHQGDAEEET